MPDEAVSCGIPALDEVIDGLRLGDNVVWQVDKLENYLQVAGPFIRHALREGRTVVGLHFTPHEPFLGSLAGMVIEEVDPRFGFDSFSAQVNRIIEKMGREVFYVFDNLSSLVADWATDELLANFFQVTCPYLYELDTIAYFALRRGQHSHTAVARIRDTTQVLIDLYHVKDELYIHPLKVQGRYSSQMFLPHLYANGALEAVFKSGDASTISLTASRTPLRVKTDSIAPWDSVYRKLAQYQEEELEVLERTSEVQALKQELSHMIVGSHPEFKRLSEEYLGLRDLLGIRNRLIGSGRIGGKAAGMLLARCILLKSHSPLDFARILEDHDSFYIGSDVFFTFLVNNDLFRLRLQLTRNSQIQREEFEGVEARFLAGVFPYEIMEQFRDLLDYFGQAPIIVRSSSLLEDGFGNSFAGKYRSEFCANQGSHEERMEAFLRAVKLVYASAVNPDALSYRRQRGLGESDEQMAILVQRVSGTRYKSHFFPSLSGVAFSHNMYRWTDRIDPSQGIIRLVFGLGTRAVNRVGNDYPRLIAVSNPSLRPEAGSGIAFYSQRKIDVLNLAENEFQSLSLADVLQDADYPNLFLFVSTIGNGYVNDPVTLEAASFKHCVVTFNNLIGKTSFIQIMKEILKKLELSYGHPVDMEFTASVDASSNVRINIVQCRPLRIPGTVQTVPMPPDLPRDTVLFRANRTIPGGVVENIRHIVYVDPVSYSRKAPLDVKRVMGRVIGQVNRHPRISAHPLMMMGPGRWGSSNIQLGVNTTYADINNVSVLVEIAREEAGHVPDVSYGTHFFLDLVESQIIYLPLYPDDSSAEFNRGFFADAPNILAELVDESFEFEEFLKVIDVPSSTGGRYAKVFADPRTGRAICFLHGSS